MNDQTSRQAIGGTSSLGGQQQGNVTYGAMPEQVTQQLTANSNSEFIVIQRTHQSDQPTVWSSGDPTQTKDLFKHAQNALNPETVG